ncbi:hypothetical protein CR513_11424, partial [Mucuna pruriens]
MFKSLTGELSELQSLLECSYRAVKGLSQREEDHCVHLFHRELDSELFTHIKGTIFNSDSLPNASWDIEIFSWHRIGTRMMACKPWNRIII